VFRSSCYRPTAGTMVTFIDRQTVGRSPGRCSDSMARQMRRTRAVSSFHTLIRALTCAIGVAIPSAGAQGTVPRDSSVPPNFRFLPPPAPVISGPLYDTLLVADGALADAMYGVSCSPKRVASLLTDDAEFYDDIVGFETRAQHLVYLERTASACMTERGVDRSVLPHTFRAYPLGAGLALTSGIQAVISRNNGRLVMAQFTTIWRRGSDGRWRASRLMTFDHREKESR